jgi:hypothetical protein
VLHVGQRSKSKCDDFATLDALDIRNKRNAAGVVFKPWVVETVGRGKIWVHDASCLSKNRAEARRRICLDFSRDDAGPSRYLRYLFATFVSK